MKEDTAKAVPAAAAGKRAPKEADFIAVHFENTESLENLFGHLPRILPAGPTSTSGCRSKAAWINKPSSEEATKIERN